MTSLSDPFKLETISGWVGFPLPLQHTAGFGVGDTVKVSHYYPPQNIKVIKAFYMDTGYRMFVRFEDNTCCYPSSMTLIHEGIISE